MKKTLLVLISVLFLLSQMVYATGQSEKAELKIGILMAFTGDLKEYGAAISKGVLLAAKQLNEAGLTVVTFKDDTETSETAGTNAAKKLVNVNGVQAIIGPLGSGVTVAVAQAVTIPNNVIVITPSGTSPDITNLKADEGKDFLFRTTPSDALQGKVAGMEAAGMVKTASIMYVNNPYGRGLAEEFTKAFEAAGGKVLVAVPHEQEAPSYNSELTKALKDKPEMLACFSYPQSAIIYVKEAIEFFKFDNFFFCDGTKSLDMIKALGASTLDGFMGTAAASIEGEALTKFNQAYEAEFSELPPLPYITNAYDAAAIIGLAAYTAQKKGHALTSANIRDHLREVANPGGEVILPGEFAKAFKLIDEGKAINYEGAAGSADMDANGDVVTPIEIWKFSGDTIVQVKIVNVAAE